MVVGSAHRDVWGLEDPDIGHRPALVLARASIPILAWLLVAPVTRMVRGIRTEVALDVEDGMPKPRAVTLENVRPVRQSLLTTRITTLAPEHMQAVCHSLRTAVAC